jgi:transposase
VEHLPPNEMNIIEEQFISDQQWQEIYPLLPRLDSRTRVGRPRVDNRACLEGILWVVMNGSRWRDLPDRFPSPATCWRRLYFWESQGVWEQVWHAYLNSLKCEETVDSAKAALNGSAVELSRTEFKVRRTFGKRGGLRLLKLASAEFATRSE